MISRILEVQIFLNLHFIKVNSDKLYLVQCHALVSVCRIVSDTYCKKPMYCWQTAVFMHVTSRAKTIHDHSAGREKINVFYQSPVFVTILLYYWPHLAP